METPKVHCYINRGLPLDPILSQINPVNTTPFHLSKIYFNVLRRMFGPKRDEMTGGSRKLLNEELRGLYSLPSIIGMIKTTIRWAGHIARMREKGNAYRLLVGKPKGTRPLGRPSCR
jgi:hypothetical protein